MSRGLGCSRGRVLFQLGGLKHNAVLGTGVSDWDQKMGVCLDTVAPGGRAEGRVRLPPWGAPDPCGEQLLQPQLKLPLARDWGGTVHPL